MTVTSEEVSSVRWVTHRGGVWLGSTLTSKYKSSKVWSTNQRGVYLGRQGTCSEISGPVPQPEYVLQASTLLPTLISAPVTVHPLPLLKHIHYIHHIITS